MPNQDAIKQQKERLSKSNFSLGFSPPTYKSVNECEHSAKAGELIDKS
jgi:hypothetical protein